MARIIADERYVIPHLMRNPLVFKWIPAFAGMTIGYSSLSGRLSKVEEKRRI